MEKQYQALYEIVAYKTNTGSYNGIQKNEEYIFNAKDDHDAFVMSEEQRQAIAGKYFEPKVTLTRLLMIDHEVNVAEAAQPQKEKGLESEVEEVRVSI